MLRRLLAILICLAPSMAPAAEAVVRDGGTLQLDGAIIRLDGIDAPESDQICVDSYADPFTCGIAARDALSALVNKRSVTCRDAGTDAASKRRLGVCTAAGDAQSLNQMLVRDGFALARGSAFKDEEAAAKDKHKGLWAGCFMAPDSFRRWDAKAALLGAACRADKDKELRAALLPADPAMPPGCSIKGTYAKRARFTGNVGVYHLQTCRSYAAITRQNRWFCTEDDARAAGFRKAFNCRPKRK